MVPHCSFACFSLTYFDCDMRKFACCLIAFLYFSLLFFGHICLSNEEIITHIKDEVVALEKSDGIPPNDVDLYRLAFQGTRELTGAQFGDIFGFVVSRQNPPVSLDNVTSIIGSKISSVTSFKSEFTKKQITFSRNVNETNETLEENFLYAFSMLNNCHLIDSTILNDQKQREVNSYNGENFRRLVFSVDGTPNLIVSERGYMSNFFMPYAPLQQSMLFDMESISMPNAWYDFLHFVKSRSPYVFEKKEEVNGRECVLLVSGSMRVCLDPDMDFAITKIEGFEHKMRIDNNDFVISSMELTVRRVLKNFRDYGNSLWLPTNIENEYFTDGTIVRRDIIQVKSVEINPHLDKDYFTDIAPQGTFVLDGTRGIIYDIGDSPSINNLLKKTVKSKRVFILQYISVTVGILMILIWIIVKYLAYRKRKNSE